MARFAVTDKLHERIIDIYSTHKRAFEAYLRFKKVFGKNRFEVITVSQQLVALKENLAMDNDEE